MNMPTPGEINAMKNILISLDESSSEIAPVKPLVESRSVESVKPRTPVFTTWEIKETKIDGVKNLFSFDLVNSGTGYKIVEGIMLRECINSIKSLIEARVPVTDNKFLFLMSQGIQHARLLESCVTLKRKKTKLVESKVEFRSNMNKANKIKSDIRNFIFDELQNL